MKLFLCSCLFFGTSLIAAVPAVPAQNVMHVDASVPSPPPHPVAAVPGTYSSPGGDTLSMNSRYLVLDGKPWLPIMGEFQYSRVPEADWENEILKMKSAGVQILSTYVIWIHQEEVKGQFDWTRQRDLRRFVQICAKHHMYVYLRIGPWTHGEVRNGGFPDWLLQEVKDPRTTDPRFLTYVGTYFNQIGDQVHGLLWKQGGPIIGVQLENEYSKRGPDAGTAYILALRRLALQAGIDAPIYSVTGWDNAVIPRGAVVAMFGGYPDAPWLASLHQLPPQEVYAFRFGSRVSGNMGAMGVHKEAPQSSSNDYPFMTTEIGGGIEDTYHRRPVIQPRDIAAIVPVMLGSGVNLYGTYMFQGGQNPTGRRTTLQESQATGYPNDLPVRSYDFQAPLGEFGQEREVFRKLKVFNYFLNDFGALLAPMAPYPPSVLPKGPADLSIPRIAVRTNGRSGFIFLNNYLRDYSMPARSGFQVQIKLPGSTLRVPAHPITLPSGAYGIWPFNLDLGTLHLRYATAQLFTHTHNGGATTYYFVAIPGVPAQFALDPGRAAHFATSARIDHQKEEGTIATLNPSLTPAITATGPSGAITRIVLVTQRQAEEMWKLQAGTASHLLLTPDQYFADAGRVTLQHDGNSSFQFAMLPPISTPPLSAAVLHRGADTPVASTFTAALPRETPQLTISQTAPTDNVPPVKLGPSFAWRPRGVAMAPSDNDFARAAKWNLQIPPQDWSGAKDLFLRVSYDGDVARLTSAGRLLDDNFYNGKPWQIGLNRFRGTIEKDGLQLEILPRRKDAPIFLERRYRDSHFVRGQVLDLRSLQLIPQYQISLKFPDADLHQSVDAQKH